MAFKDLKKGDPIYIYSETEDRGNTEIDTIKSIRKKNGKIQILTEDEYWYIPIEYENEVLHIMNLGNLKVHLCSDYMYFREIYETK
ncbi:MAG: hypothetical protein J1F35_06130 [Erysipelotrichales bacterium]|nr:hypothetical protein [Erysipelotrichales bacterium]